MEASKLDVTILSRGITLLQLLGLRYRRSAVLSARHLDDESIATFEAVVWTELSVELGHRPG